MNQIEIFLFDFILLISLQFNCCNLYAFVFRKLDNERARRDQIGELSNKVSHSHSRTPVFINRHFHYKLLSSIKDVYEYDALFLMQLRFQFTEVRRLI